MIAIPTHFYSPYYPSEPNAKGYIPLFHSINFVVKVPDFNPARYDAMKNYIIVRDRSPLSPYSQDLTLS